MMRAPKRPGQLGGTGMTLCCSGRPLKRSNPTRPLYPRSDVCYSPSAPQGGIEGQRITTRKPLSSLYTNSKYVETWLLVFARVLLFASSRAYWQEKLARKWVRALKGMCNDAKRGLECALDVLCNASKKKAKDFGFGGDGDARRWPPNKHVRKSVQAALDHIKAPWTSEMSLLIQLALGVSNDKLNRLREMLSFNLSRDSNGVHLQPTRRCFEVQGQQFQVPAIPPEQMLHLVHRRGYPRCVGSKCMWCFRGWRFPACLSNL